ncbi:hypothetical protein A3B02_01710 [Candidatus Roizmanbacteria bacterium RIFCSPLOWO2_01_FULL_42_14]|uniref:Phosphatidic acid phosphatase type 2/haloperoxidase domain-containing protein n=4 Tax=Candidatus Roizmaniibacteriota TaxID=1752723 RepID=A0A1F7JTQ2_9BACT|nr:MAG: hypothetical protein A3D08_02715 [Candidatus Roizmanbacteria bacterium RIFCSPHIGHO2_02_FULL_43_11]OGK37897.1 MAG: hypothetical protein A3F32_01740 [Candidatus Roizmanbacteria bacterium RIFCSPHIGHO2_12_FULL_42_10]OGK51554.1 MAG: hypothetical protein A3B02_01710 [Candidatus Roizmanbacteria bacterium RIFCSPLOWO2_01_FULL_42_14]OGK58996.1 MAG: hypothetical protein A3I56_01475 [Candidatus Roizmanbacteria bacterium RIFCSPLOWO2_02_FULL_43_10]
MRHLAQAISLILGVPWFFLIDWLLIFKTGLNQSQIQYFSFVMPILHIACPMIYMVWAIKERIISDFDITKRRERFSIMLVMVTVWGLSTVLASLYGNATLLNLSRAITMVFLTVFVITFFWKISLHMTVNTSGAILLNTLFHGAYLPVLVVIPLIFWSRLYLKKHTPLQLLAGCGISAGVMLAALYVSY